MFLDSCVARDFLCGGCVEQARGESFDPLALLFGLGNGDPSCLADNSNGLVDGDAFQNEQANGGQRGSANSLPAVDQYSAALVQFLPNLLVDAGSLRS